MTLEFVVNGQVLDAEELKRRSPRKTSRQKAGAPKDFHRGFVVEGHPPGSLDAARTAADKACAEWLALPEKERLNTRQPKQWDEIRWRSTSKMVRVRSRPYELAVAAGECKSLAERAGWIDVRVTPLSSQS